MKKEYDLKKLKVKRRGILPALQAKEANHSKVRITIALDKDVVDFFKTEAKKPGAFPYQTQINQALRQLMGNDSNSNSKQDIAFLKSQLLHDPLFLRELAKQVAKRK